jgi:hypothetical protein
VPSFRNALLTGGEVAVLRNVSNRTLEITLDVQSAATVGNIGALWLLTRTRLCKLMRFKAGRSRLGSELP